MEKIEKLTPEQESKFGFYVDKWLKIGLSTQAADRQKAAEAIAKVYAAASPPLDPPKIVIWLNSPMEGAVAAAALNRLGVVEDQVWDQVGDQVRDQVWGQVGGQVRDQVWAQVWDQVLDQARAQVWAQVRDQVLAQAREQVRDQVQDQVQDQVGAQVRKQVRAQVWAQAREQVREQAWDQVWLAGYGLHDADWLSFYDFFKSELGLCEVDRLDGLMELAENCGWFWPFNGAVILTEKPIETHLKDKKLHRDGGPAILYKDGLCVYALNGVVVSQEIAETPADKLSSSLILKEKNAEIRREIVRKIGIDRALKDLDAKVIDDNHGYQLLGLDLGDGRIRPYLSMQNPSIDARHIEGVHPDCTTVEQALAWRNQTTNYIKPEVLT